MKLKLFITCLMAFILSIGTASATVFLSEDWEPQFTGDDPPSCWPAKSVPTSCCASSWHGWAGRNYACDVVDGDQSGLSTSIKHSGTQSMRVYRQANSDFGPDMSRAWATDGTGATKIYFRAYFYFPTAAFPNQWHYNPTFNEGWGDHFLGFNSVLHGNALMIDLQSAGTWSATPAPACWKDPAPAQGQCYFVGDDGGGVDFGQAAQSCWDLMEHTNQWYCIEWMFDLVNDKFAMWIDGSQVIGTGGNGVSQNLSATNIYKVFIMGFRSGGQPYISRYTEYYIDDIVIADTYIGPMGSTPSQVQGLTIRGGFQIHLRGAGIGASVQ